MITLRKRVAWCRRGQTLKRGGGQVKGDSSYSPGGRQETSSGLAEILSEGPTPAFAAEVAEQCEVLLNRLGDEQLRSIAIMKMEGYTVGEIAQRLSCATRSVDAGSRRSGLSGALRFPNRNDGALALQGVGRGLRRGLARCASSTPATHSLSPAVP